MWGYVAWGRLRTMVATAVPPTSGAGPIYVLVPLFFHRWLNSKYVLVFTRQGLSLDQEPAPRTQGFYRALGPRTQAGPWDALESQALKASVQGC